MTKETIKLIASSFVGLVFIVFSLYYWREELVKIIQRLKPTFRIICGTLLLLTALVIMWLIASIPVMIVEPRSWLSFSLCAFAFMVIFIIEICLFVIWLSTYASRVKLIPEDEQG